VGHFLYDAWCGRMARLATREDPSGPIRPAHVFVKPQADEPSMLLPDPETSVSHAGVGALADRRTSSSGPSQTRPGRARIESLTALLEDDSPTVLATVHSHLRAVGRAARPALQRLGRHGSAQGRVRARAALADLRRAPVERRVVGFLTRDRIDLERGLFHLCRLTNPTFDPRPCQRQLDELAREVARKARLRTDPLQRAMALVEVLGMEHGFQGAQDEFHRADRVQIDRVLQSKRGIPLTLCAIYACVAARAGLRVGFLPLPGHVLLRLHGETVSLIVDPFHRGETRSETDLKRQLRARGHDFQPVWFRDADARSILRRQVANLARSAELYGRRGELRGLRAILTAIEPHRAASATAR